jgi:hypothetical protein
MGTRLVGWLVLRSVGAKFWGRAATGALDGFRVAKLLGRATTGALDGFRVVVGVLVGRSEGGFVFGMGVGLGDNNAIGVAVGVDEGVVVPVGSTGGVAADEGTAVLAKGERVVRTVGLVEGTLVATSEGMFLVFVGGDSCVLGAMVGVMVPEKISNSMWYGIAPFKVVAVMWCVPSCNAVHLSYRPPHSEYGAMRSVL